MGDLLHRLIGHDAQTPWRIIASPQRRAKRTAEIIASRLGRAVEFDPRLAEVSVGAWEGLLYAEIAKDDPTFLTDREWFFRGPGGETYDDVMGRVRTLLLEQEAEAHRRLIVVSHGVAGRLLRGAYAGLSRHDTMQQDVPQDAIFRLSGGTVERLECEAVL